MSKTIKRLLVALCTCALILPTAALAADITSADVNVTSNGFEFSGQADCDNVNVEIWNANKALVNMEAFPVENGEFEGTISRAGLPSGSYTVKIADLEGGTYYVEAVNLTGGGSSGGGGGGGASKPSIRPSDDKPTTPVTPVVPTEPTFTDVPATHWASADIEQAVAMGLINGVGGNKYAPNNNTTRAQLMTILARLAGADTSGDALAKGMAWAKENGISDGTNPNGNITREQLATMLYRYAGSPAVSGDLSKFADASSVSDWALDAMIWATQNGIITGTTPTTLAPGGNATRAQVATMVIRFSKL